MRATNSDPLTVLMSMADDSASAVGELKGSVPGKTLQRAVRMIRAANRIAVLGPELAEPVAVYLADGLVRHGCRCRLIQGLGSAVTDAVSALSADDLLVTVLIDSRAGPIRDVLPIARQRRVRVIGIADSEDSPMAQRSDVCFIVPSVGARTVQPLAPHMVLVQSLLASLNDE